MTTHQINHRYTGTVLFECDAGLSTQQMLEKAIIEGANLRGANFINGRKIVKV